MIDFEKLGYKDITKDNPIHFRECLGIAFDDVYPYNKRFYKKEDNIITILKVGNNYGFVFVEGICYYSKGWEKFNVNTSINYIEDFFKQTIEAVKRIISIKECDVNLKKVNDEWMEFNKSIAS